MAVVAWSAAIVSVILGLLGHGLMAVTVRAGALADPYWGAGFGWATVFPVIGALIAARHPRNTVGWLFLIVGLTSGLAILAQEYAVAVWMRVLDVSPAALSAAWLGSWLGNVGWPMTLFVLLLFPTGRLPSWRWRPVAWSAGVAIVGDGLRRAFSPGLLVGPTEPPLPNPFAFGAAEAWQLVELVAQPLLIVAALGCIAAPFWRWRRARGDERRQLEWFAYGVALAVLSLFGNAVLPDLAWAIGGASMAFVAVTIGIAIIKYRLYDIELIIRRTLVYAALTLALSLVYWAMVVLLAQLLRPLTQGSELAIVGSTLAVAALFQPARRRIQHVVDRRFYRQRYDATHTLEAFSSRLRSEVDLDSLGVELLGVVRQTMQPQHLSLWLRPRNRRPS